ncbi:hypothetical protein [Ideonella livida]|uniref:Uncharacterized protein n=1 Tax=Ideonella livida TaxID=2707176 RepID=A0A7C9PIQ4_9BURK|nr:hypothetical protein [Ideonella livida]NDY93013.1 hypothetical protein [Ideonella livida]
MSALAPSAAAFGKPVAACADDGLPSPWRAQLPRQGALALVLSLMLALSGCGGGGGDDDGGLKLRELPLQGAPGAPGQYAARSPGGHYHLLSNPSIVGSQFRLPPGGTSWEAVTPDMRSFSAPQPDHRVYGQSTYGQLSRLDDTGWTPLLPAPAAGTVIYLGKRLDGQHVAYSRETSTGVGVFYAAPEGGGWSLLGSAPLPWAGIRPVHMTATGRLLTWEDRRGLVEVDPVAHTTTVIAGCDAPSMSEGCATFRYGLPDRSGHYYWLNLTDLTGFQIELWRLPAGSATPERVAGPRMPSLPRSVDGASNAYGGPTSLYADRRGRIWLSLRWGNNSAADANYLYRTEGGDWRLLSKDAPRNAQFFGEGDLPGLMAISLYGAVRVYQAE